VVPGTNGDALMVDSWQIRVYDQQQLVYSGEVSGKVELGRQGDSGERLYSKKYLEREGRWRLLGIAPMILALPIAVLNQPPDILERMKKVMGES